jgi:peptidyl-prolyl cis-trans isomerase D
MLTLRKGAANLVAKLFMGVLVVSFGIWGVADFLRSATRPVVATVGNVRIAPDDYQRSYQRQMSSYSARLGRQITSQEARAAGLPRQILDGLIARAAITQKAQALGMGISEKGIRNDILNDQSFANADGKFSQAKFEQLLRANNMSEPAYVEELHGDMVRQQLLGAFTQGAVVPDELLEAVNRYRNEERVLVYFTAGQAAAGDIPAPAEEQLKTYYEDHKAHFSAPEYRKIAIVTANADSVGDKVSVSDEEARQDYEAEIDKYRSPERRKIEQIAFPDKAAAQKAASELAGGKSFYDVAKEAGFTQADTALGLLTKDRMADPKVAEAAFALPKGKVSDPIDGALATAIVRVLEIYPAEEKKFDEVKEQVRKAVKDRRVKEKLSDVANAFEDDRTQGASLADAAKKHGLKVEQVTFDRAGKGEDGKPVSFAGAEGPLYKAAFESDVGVDNAAVRLSKGAYAWFDVLDVIPPRQKTFEEVKDGVSKAWRDDQIRAKLVEKSQELQKRIEGGESIEEAAKSLGAEAKTTAALKRSGIVPGLPISMIAQAFAMQKDGVNAVAGSDHLSRVVFQVKEIKEPAALDAPAQTNLRDQLARTVAADNLSQFIQGVRSDLGAEIDEREFAALGGAGSEE